MSLKAKLEAVIYAAEEPVTLAQLAALFAADAFEWKAEQEAAAKEAAAEAAVQQPETLPMLTEGMDYLGLDAGPDDASEPAAAAEQEAAPATTEPPVAEAPSEAQPEATPSADATAAESTLDTETEAKRQARLRDREVRAILRQILDELIADYVADSRGVEIREIAGGYRMATKPECHDAVRLFIKSLKPALKLSLPALETLAVIAYKQPVTAPEVNEIRGVESGGVLGSLLSRKLIATAGRKQVIGRPILYKTTKEFLLRFGLKDVSELPSMEEFEKIAASELSETAAEEAANQEIGGPAIPGTAELEEITPEDEVAPAEMAPAPLAEPSAETPVEEEATPETAPAAPEAEPQPERTETAVDEVAPAEPPTQEPQEETEKSPHE
jgi:segregation and condensation protein B